MNTLHPQVADQVKESSFVNNSSFVPRHVKKTGRGTDRMTSETNEYSCIQLAADNLECFVALYKKQSSSGRKLT